MIKLKPKNGTHSRRRRGGRPPPHSVQNVENHQKFRQMVYLFGQIVWILGHTIAKIPSQFRCRPFFLFFSIWTEKPFKFQGRPFFFFFFFWRTPQFGQKKPSQFWQRNAMHQIIFRAKVCCPPKSFWAPTAMMEPFRRIRYSEMVTPTRNQCNFACT